MKRVHFHHDAASGVITEVFELPPDWFDERIDPDRAVNWWHGRRPQVLRARARGKR